MYNLFAKFNHLYLGTGCVCVVLGGKAGGGAPPRHGHKESYKDLNLKNSTFEWDSNPRPHNY